jgi:cytidylate kinase
MRYRALTIAREYGSGGAEIAAIIARDLGWRLVDKELISEISKRASISTEEAVAFDEKVDPWLHRVTRSIWGIGVDGVSPISPVDLFDAEKAAAITNQIIREAYRLGNCVLVGRGSQCILKGMPDVFHAFIYARWDDRVQRIRHRNKGVEDIEGLIRSTDLDRGEYVRIHYNQDRFDHYLYDLMMDSKNQPEKTARIIIAAMRMAPDSPAE